MSKYGVFSGPYFPIFELNTEISEVTLRKKGPYLELFWSAFSRMRTEYGEILSISSYSVLMRENADQNNSEYGEFSCSVNLRFQSEYRKISVLFGPFSRSVIY